MHSIDELNALNSTVDTIIVDNNACNEQSFTVLDLTRFANLRVFEVGSHSLYYVAEVKLIGLSKLESVVIGKNSFTENRNAHLVTGNPNHHFYLKNCEKLRELKIGPFSFNEYSVIEITNVNSLEVIEIGEYDESSNNFKYSSLELKSNTQRRK